tara:strand:+ start:130 stop:936 length:807 start_codon:yes stop_codon:yes gene_type:complete
MQRALRGVIIERIEAFSKDRVWIEKDLASKIRHRIIGAVIRQKSVIEVVEVRIGETSELQKKISPKEIDRLVEIACHRFHAAIKSKPISEILQGKITDWHTFSRLDKTKLDNFELHISPDLAWRSGRTWHLMRFTVQGVSNPGDDRRLENIAMVMWALLQNGIPTNAERYIVENLYWSRGSWKRWNERANQRLLDDAIKMIHSDMNAMIDLHDRLGPSCDLSQIPLANSKRLCQNCGHRDTCPGGEDLVRAKLEQSVLEMAKSSQLRN